MLAIFRAVPIFRPQRLSHSEFSSLWGVGTNLRTKIAMTRRVESLLSIVILVIFWLTSLQALPRGFVSFDDACTSLICQSRVPCHKLPCAGGSGPYKASLIPHANPTFSVVLQQPIAVCLFVLLRLTFLTKHLALDDRVSMLLEFLSAASPDHVSLSRGFPIQFCELRKTNPRFR